MHGQQNVKLLSYYFLSHNGLLFYASSIILIFYNFSKRNIKAPSSWCRNAETCRSVCTIYICVCVCVFGPGTSVGIATELRTGRSGIESRCGRDFPPVQTIPGAHLASCTIGTVSFPGVKCGRGVLLTTHPLLVPRSWKSTAKPLPTLWATPDP